MTNSTVRPGNDQGESGDPAPARPGGVLSRRGFAAGAVGVAGTAALAAGTAGPASARGLPAMTMGAPAAAAGGVRFGVNYLPSKAWFYTWENWDLPSIEADLHAIAGLGFDHIRVQCLWSYFQPNQTYQSPTALRRLAQLLDVAHAHQLAVQVTVLTGVVTNQYFMPPWLTLAPGQIVNMFTDTAAIAAEQRLFTSIAERLAGHPAFLGFDLGNEVDIIPNNTPGQATTQDQGDAWLTAMLGSVSGAAPEGVNVCGTTKGSWIGNNPGAPFTRTALASLGSLTTLHWYDFNAQPPTSSPTHDQEFGLELAQAYAADPARLVWLGEFGASAQPGATVPPFVPPSQIPDYLEAVIRNVMTVGNLWGWSIWASHNEPDSFTFIPRSRRYGMLDSSNRPTPSGQRVAGLIREFRAHPPAPPVRSTGLVIPDALTPSLATVGEAYLKLLAGGTPAAVVLESRAGDTAYLQARGITTLVPLSQV